MVAVVPVETFTWSASEMMENDVATTMDKRRFMLILSG
jgi:hypothetical protein